MAEAQRQLDAVNNQRYLLSYEKFIADPHQHLADLVRFCGLVRTDDQIAAAITAGVNTTRVHAFMNKPDLVQFYRSVRTTPWMVRHGYDKLSSLT